MIETKWMDFLIEDDRLLEKYDTIWDEVSADIKKKFIASLSITNIFWKQKENIMGMKLQIFSLKRFLGLALMVIVQQYLAWILLLKR